MAARKKPETPEAEVKDQPEAVAEAEAPEAEAPKAEAPKAEEPKAEEEAPEAQDKMIQVRNVKAYDYVQPSTGIKIRADRSEPTKVLDDNWIEQFIAAGILERV